MSKLLVLVFAGVLLGTFAGNSVHAQADSISISKDDVTSISLDAESAERGAVSVYTFEDLSVYATSKMKRDSNIEVVDASSDHISLTYRKPARFLGFIPGSLKVSAGVDESGRVDINYPWYRFLFAVEGSDGMKTDLEARVQEVMTDASGMLSARVEAKLLEALHAGLSGSVESEGSITTADMAGGPEELETSGTTEEVPDVSEEGSPE